MLQQLLLFWFWLSWCCWHLLTLYFLNMQMHLHCQSKRSLSVSSPVLTFINLFFDVIMRLCQQSSLIYLSVPADRQRCGRVSRGRPRSPSPEGLLPLSTWCLCCAFPQYPVNSQDKQKWRDEVSLLDAWVDRKSFKAAVMHQQNVGYQRPSENRQSWL